MHDPSSTLTHVYVFRLFLNGIESNKPLGLAFSSKADALREAAAATAKIIAGKCVTRGPGFDWRMDVADAAGDLIYRFSFKAERLDEIDGDAER